MVQTFAHAEVTVPERAETLEAQARWLAEKKRGAVLVTPGSVLPHFPLWTEFVQSEYGLIAYNPEQWRKGDLLELVKRGELGLVLGYGIGRKPTDVNGAVAASAMVVTVRGADGLEKQGVCTDEKHLPSVLRAAHQVKDKGDLVRLESPETVLAQRLGETMAVAFPEVRLIQNEVEGAAVAAAAEADGTVCLAPSHLIERDGKIVGYVGMDSVPLFRVWLGKDVRRRESFSILNVIENLYRARGVRLVATLLMPGSPFGPMMPRMGYKALGETVLHLKHL
jgi:hypothetical protein